MNVFCKESESKYFRFCRPKSKIRDVIVGTSNKFTSTTLLTALKTLIKTKYNLQNIHLLNEKKTIFFFLVGKQHFT